MGRTAETPLPVPREYRELVAAAIAKGGTQQEVADRVGINQGTISRLSDPAKRHPATYTTWKKIADAFDLPEPAICVRSAEHREWCVLGDLIAQISPATFQSLLDQARREMRLAHMDATSDGEGPALDDVSVDRLKALISAPLPGRSPTSDRRR